MNSLQYKDENEKDDELQYKDENTNEFKNM